MSEDLLKTVESALERCNSAMGKAKVELQEVKGGTIIVKYHQPPSTLGVCHPDKTQVTEELVIEILEDQLKPVVPNFERVLLSTD